MFATKALKYTLPILATSLGSVAFCESKYIDLGPTETTVKLHIPKHFSFFTTSKKSEPEQPKQSNVNLFACQETQLSQNIFDKLNKTNKLQVSTFADKEIRVEIDESVRNKNVFVLNSIHTDNSNVSKNTYANASKDASVNDKYMQLLLTCDAMHRASANKITAVMPYFGYARQDRKDKGRVPISASTMAQLLQRMHVDRVITIDLHCDQIQGFFDIPVDNLNGSIVAAKHIYDMYAKPSGYVFYDGYGSEYEANIENQVCIVSPDAGGVARAKKFKQFLEKYVSAENCDFRYEDFRDKNLSKEQIKKDSANYVNKHLAKHFKYDFAMISKQRSGANQIESMQLIGDVKDKTVIIVDDMIDTGGTICKAAKMLKEKGANKVIVFVSHALLNRDAKQKIEASEIDDLVVLNTIEHETLPDKVTVLDVSKLLTKAMECANDGGSISELFN